MMINRVQVSVVMAVRNGLPFVKEAVKSILNQTFNNFEFIIVDDASNDGTILYLKSIKDKRVKLIINKKNLGLARSLNKALEIAKGKYIARMDADDVSLPRRLDTQFKFLVKNPSIDICGTWVKLVDEDKKVLSKIHTPVGDKQIKSVINWLPPLVHPSWFLKRIVYVDLNGYDESADMAEDFEFLIRAKKFKMANVNQELLLWRNQTGRRSKKDIQKMYESNFRIKWRYFKKGEFGISYLPFLVRSFISTYFFPIKLKVFLNRRAKYI